MQGAASMIKQIQKIGNSRGIVLDRALLDHLGVANGGSVELTMQENAIVIRPLGPGIMQQRPRPQPFEEAMEATFQQYDGAMKRLAE